VSGRGGPFSSTGKGKALRKEGIEEGSLLLGKGRQDRIRLPGVVKFA